MGKGGQSLRPPPLRAHPNPPHRTRPPEAPTGLRPGSKRLPEGVAPAPEVPVPVASYIGFGYGFYVPF